MKTLAENRPVTMTAMTGDRARACVVMVVTVTAHCGSPTRAMAVNSENGPMELVLAFHSLSSLFPLIEGAKFDALRQQWCGKRARFSTAVTVAGVRGERPLSDPTTPQVKSAGTQAPMRRRGNA
jgi:hypothetical protein